MAQKLLILTISRSSLNKTNMRYEVVFSVRGSGKTYNVNLIVFARSEDAAYIAAEKKLSSNEVIIDKAAQELP